MLIKKAHSNTILWSKLADVFLLSIFVCVGCLCAWFNTAGEFNSCLAWLVIFISAYSVYKARKNLYLFIIYGIILYCNYSICMVNYISPIDSFFTSWSRLSIATDGLYILFAFSILLNIIVPRNGYQPPVLIEANKSNVLIAYITLVILICVGIFSFTRPEIAGDRGGLSPLYEYSTVLAILGIYYSGKSYKLYILYSCVLIGFALQNFIFGGRITGIQLFFCLFLCFFGNRIALKYLLPFGIVGFILMSIIGQFRTQISFNMDTLGIVFDTLKYRKFTLDTAWSAYFTSLTFLAMLGLVTWSGRLYLFSRFVIYLFLGSQVPLSDLSILSHDYFFHYYGGILPFYGYFYLGIFGMILLALYLRWLFIHISQISTESSGLWRCVAIYITITSLRWYLYSPSQLLRGCGILAICYGMCSFFHFLTYRQKKI